MMKHTSKTKKPQKVYQQLSCFTIFFKKQKIEHIPNILYLHKCALLPKTSANNINHYTKTSLNDGKQKVANCFSATKRIT